MTRLLTDEQLEDATNLCTELPLIEARLHRAGLHITGHKVNAAVKSIGWELAELARAVQEARIAEQENTP